MISHDSKTKSDKPFFKKFISFKPNSFRMKQSIDLHQNPTQIPTIPYAEVKESQANPHQPPI